MTDTKGSPDKESISGAIQVTVNDEEEEKFRCSFCALVYSSRKEVLVHEWQHKERQTFSCTVCSRSFTNKNLFDRHVSAHNKLGQRGSLCNICNKTFRNHRELDKHHQKDHKGQKSFRCGICGLLFSWMDNLQKHMRVHVDKPIGCFRCHKSFRDEESLKQHALVHRREDVEKRAQGLPVTPSTQESENQGAIMTIGMPGNLTTRIPARSITVSQQKDIPIATSLTKPRSDQPTQVIAGGAPKGGSNAEPSAVLNLADPQQMAALLEGYMNDDQLTSTAETIDMINSLSVDTNVSDKVQLDKNNSKSPKKGQKDSQKSPSTSISPNLGGKTITYTLARPGASSVTASYLVPKSSDAVISTQTLNEGTNNVTINGARKGSTITIVSQVITSPISSNSYAISGSKHTDTGTGPMSASETKLLEEMDKPHRCHICGKCFKYEFSLDAHMPEHKEALPAWKSRGVLVPYGNGVKSLVLEEAMPIKPHGCPVCKETFRHSSCLKAHFMKSHPIEYKQHTGVDPEDIQAKNIANPRIKRPYHRKTTPRPDVTKSDKLNTDNLTPKPKVQQKVDKDKLRKKLDSLIIETPKVTLPKSKKDRLRPMPPHLLAKEMEEQEAREKAEKERLAKEEAERIRLEEEDRLKKEEEEKLKREEDERKAKAAQDKISSETISSNSVQQHQQQVDDIESTEKGKQHADQTKSTINGEAVEVGKPLFVVPLFGNQVAIAVDNTIQQPVQDSATGVPAIILPQGSKPSGTGHSQTTATGKAIETTTIDLSQLKEVTTPIIEEVGETSPLGEQYFNAQSSEAAESEADEPNVEIGEIQSTENEIRSTENASESSGVQLDNGSDIGIKASDIDKDNERSEPDKDDECTTPKKLPGKNRKPRTPKSAKPVHRILTRRKYAHDEEERFKAEREAAQQRDGGRLGEVLPQDEEMQVEELPSSSRDETGAAQDSGSADEANRPAQSVVNSSEGFTAISDNDMEQIGKNSEVTSTNMSTNEQDNNDGADAQSIQSESVNSVVSMDTNKESSEDVGLENMETESQKSSSVVPNNENEQSVKSDGQSEDGLETIVIILKESENKSAAITAQTEVPDPPENSSNKAATTEQTEVIDPPEKSCNKTKSIEEWIDKTDGKEETRSRKGKHLRSLSKRTDEEDSHALKRKTRSAIDQKKTESQPTESPRVFRKRGTGKGDAPKETSGSRKSERNTRSSPQKEISKSNMGRTLRERPSPAPVEKKETRNQSTDSVKDKNVAPVKIKECSVTLVDNVTLSEKVDKKNKMGRDKSIESDKNSDRRSRLRRRLSTDSLDESHKKDVDVDSKGKKESERMLRRRPSTESVDSESAISRERVLIRRLSASSLDGSSRSRSSSRPRRTRDVDRRSKISNEDATKIRRQLRKRPSPEKSTETKNTPSRAMRRRNSESKRETSIEKEGRSDSGSRAPARKLRSSRSSSWEEQAKALSKCSVKLQRCDTPVQQLEENETEGTEETKEKDESVILGSPRKKTLSERSFEIMNDSLDLDDGDKDPLQSVLEKETELVLNHIQREKETRAAAEKKAKEDAVTVVQDKNEEVSEKDSVDSASLDMVSLASEVSIEEGMDRADNDTQNEDGLRGNMEEDHSVEISDQRLAANERNQTEEIKENKESRKPKRSRSRKKQAGINVYELLRQQKDKIQTKVLGKTNHEFSPKEKKKSPESLKKNSPDLKKHSPDSQKSPSELGKERVNKSKRTKREKQREEEITKSKEQEESDLVVEKEIGTITHVEEGKETSPKQKIPKSPSKIKNSQANLEDNLKDSDSDEDTDDLNQLLGLATSRTLRSEVKSPVKDDGKHQYTSNLRQDASDFEKAVHLSLIEAQKSRKGKKKKKKHKRDKRDSSPFSLPEACDHSAKPKKKKKKKKHKHKSEEEKLLDLSEEQVEMLEQSFELMMPDLFKQLTIESPTGTEGDLSFTATANVEPKAKKDKKQSPEVKQPAQKANQDALSPTRERKSSRTDEKRSPQSHDKRDTAESNNSQSPKSQKNKKPEPPSAKAKSKEAEVKKSKEAEVKKSKEAEVKKSKEAEVKKSKEAEVTNELVVVKEQPARTTRSKLAKSQELEFRKQIEESYSSEPVEKSILETRNKDKKTEKRNSSRKAEKRKSSRIDKQEAKRDAKKDHEHERKKSDTETKKKVDDKVGNSKNDTERDNNYEKRDKHEKRVDSEKRPRTENLFLQDISQTPKFFEHNISLTNSLSQVPPTLAPIAPVQFRTLTDPSRKRGIDTLLSNEPPSKAAALENDSLNTAPPPKRKRGRPPKANKQKNATQAAPSLLPSPGSASLTPHIPSVFSHSLGSTVFGNTPHIEAPVTTEPKEKSTKKGRKRKRGSSGRIEIRGQEIVYMEEKDSNSENSLGADTHADNVIGEVHIKQEVESSETEDTCGDVLPNGQDEGREVIMVSVATMTDSSYLMDLRKLMQEQEQMEAEAADVVVPVTEPDRESEKKGSKSPRLTVKLYRCDYCTRPFTQRSWMVLHKLREHGYSCQSQAIYMHTLARRVMRRVFIEWRRFGCELCHRRFNHKSHYIFHQSREHRRKQYRCGVCNETSDSYTTYQMHAVFVHKAVMRK